ncbi:condensation domain-containing protein [Streptomyces sp. 3211.6]|uniref:condensation domain-containing protein n=1 Tax=Streptomyces sp. 3211.6 TaxID=1938845 RepID=UPI000EAD4AEB|nr:condensation domain-containing protein [Streptomyces sp. 3211.6]RKS97039.1 condensation domain-containing protein [Streptomyces sp. 3211.6]
MTGRPGDGPRRAPASRVLAAPRPRVHPAAPLQVDVLLDGLTHPGRGLHTGQLHWRLPGPFDAERFTRAWQTVTDQEAVLRTGLAPAASGTGTGLPGFAVHPAAGPLIVRHPVGGAQWEALLAAERMREFDLTRSDPLRIALLEEPDGSTRVLLTYHRAFLDPVGAEQLVRAFHRAHAADGRPRGGERRPDLRDHLQWIGTRDRAPAREFWARAAPPAGSATLPAGDRGRPTHQRGHGRTRQRLTPAEAARLRGWAAARGAAESTALQAVWALLLYRAADGGPGPVPVAFGAAVSGRGIPLDGADRLPGPLLGALPVGVEVRPGGTLADLLSALAGRAVDLAAYEWVSAGQVHRWSGRDPYDPLTESVLAFLPPREPRLPSAPRPLAAGGPPQPELPAGALGESPFPVGELGETASPVGPWAESPFPAGPFVEPASAPGWPRRPASPAGPFAEPAFPAGPEAPSGPFGAAGGDGVGPAEECEAYTGTPLVLTARHDVDGGLLLTLVHDRTRIADGDADEILWQVACLLRGLPADADPGATVTEALRLLDGAPVPLAAAPPDPPPRTLRAAAAPGTGLVCLLRPPGAPEDCYDGLVHGRRGRRALLSVAPRASAALAALAPALAAGEPVVLGGYPEVADLAHQVAGRVAAYGWARPPVAVAATERELAAALTAAGRKRP